MGTEDIIESLGQRSATYRLLATLLFKPLTQEQIDALAQTLPTQVPDGGEAAAGMHDMARYLRLRNTGTREELACDFTGAFYGVTTLEGRTAMPYESLFREGGQLLMGTPRGEVYRAFKARGMRVAAGLDMPEDHLSFIFDFMAELCDRCAKSLRDGDEGEAARLLDEQLSMLEDHVASWYGDFRALADKLVTTRFYHGCLRLIAGFVESEPAQIALCRQALAGADAA